MPDDHAAHRIELLKHDLFGSVTLRIEGEAPQVVRDARAARPWLGWLARHLARREARALERLRGLRGVPQLLAAGRGVVVRSWVAGEPMHRARPRDPRYFREAFALLCRLHRRNVVHNDLAKEPNWLVTPEGGPALVDFQLAVCAARRGRLFRALARDDLRHLLKHKRTYLPERLTARERAMLARPSLPARLWRASGKRLYLLVTRRLLHWADREGAGERQARP